MALASAGRQGRPLFAYLVVNRHRQVTRGAVAEALWREPDPGAVDGRHNPLLSKLRRVLGPQSVDGRTTLRLCLPDARVDLEAAAVHPARPRPGVLRRRRSGPRNLATRTPQ